MQDCLGTWGGNYLGSGIDGLGHDICGTCGGTGPGENYDCDGICIAELDCGSVCGGDDFPDYTCPDNSANNVACDYSDCILLSTITYTIPNELSINRIYPNPFNPQIKIEYEISIAGNIYMAIYNLRGRQVDILLAEY
jgi:hypothetical protein